MTENENEKRTRKTISMSPKMVEMVKEIQEKQALNNFSETVRFIITSTYGRTTDNNQD